MRVTGNGRERPCGGPKVRSRLVVGALIAALSLQACSSRPREFEPTLATPATDQAAFDTAYATCQRLFIEGKLDSSGRAGSAGAGLAAGGATAAIGSTAAAATAGYAGMAVAAATIVLLPFAVLGGAWGLSRAKRAQKERAIKTAMEGCLAERGYQVAGWSKSVKRPVVVTEPKAAQ